MRYKLTTAILTVFIIFTSLQKTFGQCPEGELVITSQSEMFAFERRYPNCTELDSNLIIKRRGSSILEVIRILVSLSS